MLNYVVHKVLVSDYPPANSYPLIKRAAETNADFAKGSAMKAKSCWIDAAASAVNATPNSTSKDVGRSYMF